jgi:para-nitrobenzyl esterase
MEKTVVETRFGKLQGVDLGPVLVWKGIPYASPPIGARRFLPPHPPEPWAGVREALTFGPIAPQLPFRVANGSLEIKCQSRKARIAYQDAP